MDHPDEREKVANACLEFKSGAYTALSEDEKEAAKKSPWMTNCNNVGIAMMNAYQKRLRDAAAKYAN